MRPGEVEIVFNSATEYVDSSQILSVIQRLWSSRDVLF